jgi:hypothetical protein
VHLGLLDDLLDLAFDLVIQQVIAQEQQAIERNTSLARVKLRITCMLLGLLRADLATGIACCGADKSLDNC